MLLSNDVHFYDKIKNPEKKMTSKLHRIAKPYLKIIKFLQKAHINTFEMVGSCKLWYI